MPRLENWSFERRVENVFQAPETGVPCLSGIVFGHPHHQDGENVRTSPLVEFDGIYFITGSGSRYRLGSVDPEYERLFPNAYHRLCESFRKEKGIRVDVKA